MHAPESIEGGACWFAATSCVRGEMGGATVDMSAALAVARESDVTGWAAARLIAAVRAGLGEAMAKRSKGGDDGGRDP